MGRPKNYEVEEATARALSAFWKTGFEATSLKDLEAATGLNKFSLYASFGSKRGLYLACLDLYITRYLGPYFAQFDPRVPGAVEAFLEGVVANLEATQGWGCVLLNGGVEFQGRDAEVNQRIMRTYGVLTDTMEAVWHDRSRAEAFTAFVRGLMASGRLGVDGATLRSAIAGARPLWSA